MENEDFGRQVAELVRSGKFPALLSLMHGIGLPEGWQEMVRPLFEGYLGQPVSSSIIPAAEIPEHQQVWLKKAPEDIRKELKYAVKLSYETVHSVDNKESGELILPIIFLDNKWVLLLVGPGD